ncbi:MAG: LTA synthase family protein [Aminipila sp.]
MNNVIEFLKESFNLYKDIFKEFLIKFKDKYSVLGLVTVGLVVLKYLVFYNLMSVKANFIIVWIISLAITYFLFASFKNKYIPAGIYLVLSILMFADVTYCSFFNKYLSVAMIGSAGMLGDITESIKEVMKPINFVMILDSIFVFVTLIASKKGGFNKPEFLNKFKRKDKVEENQAEKKTENEVNKPKRDILAELDAMSLEEDIAENQEAVQLSEWKLPDINNIQDSSEEIFKNSQDATESIDIILNKEQSYKSNELKSSIYQGRVNRKRKEKKRKKESIRKIAKFKNLIIPVCLIFILIVTSFVSPFMQSMAKQEFFTYHVGDIVTEAFGLSSPKRIMEFTDHYEQEKEGPLFGIGKDKNLVVIQIESFQNFLIGMNYNGQEVTPFLNSLIQDKSIYFDNYYQQVGTGNTSDAEFATNNSIMGSIEAFTYQLFEKNYFRGLPVLLKEQGYETAVLHAHENREFWNRDDIYPSLGFDHYYGGLKGDTARRGGNFNMTEWMGWGLTDTEFYPQAMEYIKELKEPFYSFVITLSNHHPYVMLDKYKFIELAPEDEGTLAGNYLNSAAYTDYALSQLFEEFKKAGLYEDTVFALYGDHMGLSAEEETNEVMARLLGHEYDWDDRMNIPLIIHVPDANEDVTQTIHNVGGQVDFMPTISYIMGLDSLDTVYLGHNLFNYDKGVVAEHAYLPYGSFFTAGYGFEMSRDGVFKNSRAWDLETRKEVDVDDFYDEYLRSMEISDTSVYILQNDILRKIYQEGISKEEVFK